MRHQLFLSLVLVTALAAPALADASFFPARPSSTLSQIQGKLTLYGHGNELGSFIIVDSKNVAHTLYMGKNMQIDGKRIFCGYAPTTTFKPDTIFLCPDWPTNLTIGHSIVKAVFWNTTYQGKVVQASDSITVVTP